MAAGDSLRHTHGPHDEVDATAAVHPNVFNQGVSWVYSCIARPGGRLTLIRRCVGAQNHTLVTAYKQSRGEKGTGMCIGM